ncbi:MAG: hypothetical protein WDN30_14105 [Pararobbsia sp.]
MKITHYDDYRAPRAAAYPDIGDQLDAIWKLLETQYAGATMPPDAARLAAAVRAVKAKYPKPPTNVE